MSQRQNSDHEYSMASWFPESLSDEAAVAMYLFLEQFTWQFEDHYYAQIRRYYQQREEAQTEHQLEMPWEDGIPF